MSWLYYDEETGAYSYPEDDDPESSDPFPEEVESGDEGDDFDGEPVGPDDLSDDGDALASAGFGTDEDYGYDGGDEW